MYKDTFCGVIRYTVCGIGSSSSATVGQRCRLTLQFHLGVAGTETGGRREVLTS